MARKKSAKDEQAEKSKYAAAVLCQRALEDRRLLELQRILAQVCPG